MTARTKEHPIDEVDLMKAAGSRLQNAPAIWQRFMKLKAEGKKPEVTRSSDAGYRLNEDGRP